MRPRGPQILGHTTQRGDGPPADRDLKEYLVGKDILDVEHGAMTAEGFTVVKFRFRGGDELLIVPQPVEPAVTLQTGLRLAIRFVFLPTQARRIWTPGMAR